MNNNLENQEDTIEWTEIIERFEKFIIFIFTF